MKQLLILLVMGLAAMGAAFFIIEPKVPFVATSPTSLSRMHSPAPSFSVAPISSVKPTPKASTTATPTPAPSYVVNLSVPFTVQAPFAVWTDPYGEFCEEASVLMAASYYKKLTIPSPDFADKKMFEIKDFEDKRFGYSRDTTAEETAIILKEFYGISAVRTVYNPTENDIKQALDNKKVVIIPAAGRRLGNPNFRAPGPIYHMFVVKGYTKDGSFVTNDPGTRKGADYIYSAGVIMSAIHDWNGGNVDSGQKVIIIVG